MLFVPLVYWSFSFIGIGKYFRIETSQELIISGRICRSGNLWHSLLGSYSDHQPMGQPSRSFLLRYRLVSFLTINHMDYELIVQRFSYTRNQHLHQLYRYLQRFCLHFP
jgi:hypothetical protein